MTATPFIFLGIGLLLIFLEFFLPGGVMGIAGGVFLVVSIVFFSIQTESAIALILYIVGIVLLLVFLIKFSLWRIRTGRAKGIFLNTAQEGYVASQFAKELIGKKGKALSDLKPAGHILVEGKRYQAVSKSGYIVKESEIEVVGGEGAHLVVKLIQTKEKES
ncbi:MAG: NfeD family protein [Chlamydiales bacterium]